MARIALFLIVLSPAFVLAQPPSNFEHLKGLEPMIGEWKAAGGDITGTVTVAWVANKNAVEMEAKMNPSGLDQQYLRKVTYYWDAVDQKIKAFGFDNMGACAHVTVAVDGKKITETGEVRMADGQKQPANIECEFTDEQWKLSVNDGAMEFTMTRTKK